MLSLNGSPLANPYELGLDWLAGSNSPAAGDDGGNADSEGERNRTQIKRSVSHTGSILVRRDPSFASTTSGGLHSRSNSQSTLGASSQPSHSRSNSRTGRPLSQLSSVSSGHVAARVAVPTKDGHMLEFDPFTTSPASFDKLEGITESAKKQAKEDMSKLVQAAVSKWTIKG